jgi:transposase-like protein
MRNPWFRGTIDSGRKAERRTTMGMKGAARCPGCKSTHIEYQGVDEQGNQKWRCKECGTRFNFKPSEAKAS